MKLTVKITEVLADAALRDLLLTLSLFQLKKDGNATKTTYDLKKIEEVITPQYMDVLIASDAEINEAQLYSPVKPAAFLENPVLKALRGCWRSRYHVYYRTHC